jgi:GABA(A) receptor-associated protein
MSYSFEQRCNASKKLRRQFPDRIPIIVDRQPRSDLPLLDKRKYLVRQDMTIGKFLFELRKNLKISHEKAVFLFINNIIPAQSAFIGTLDEKHVNADGFLYIFYSAENTFG